MMKLTLKKSDILQPLTKACGAVAKGANAVAPILKHVLIEADGGMARFTGADLDVTIITHAKCEADAAGQFCLPADKLLAAVKSFDSDAITISVNGDKSMIACGRSRLRLPVLPASDFMRPDMPDVDPVSLSAPDFASVLSYIKPAIAQKDVRYYLNGVHLEVQDGIMTAVATDGHRMNTAKMDAEGEWSMILPRRGVEELAGMLTGGTVSLTVSKNLFVAQSASATLVAKQIDGKYPDWRRVVPERVQPISVETARIRSALERAAIVAVNRGVRLEVGAGSIGIQAGQGDQVIDDAVDADTLGNNLVIGVDLIYLLDALKVAGSETVEIEMAGPDRAMLVKPTGDESRFCVVMPMRL